MKDDAETDMRGSLRLEGRLLDEQGQAVAGASVYLDGGRCAVAQADGRFAFTDLAPGLYRLSAGNDHLVTDLTLVTLREERDPVELTMSPGITLRVHVTDGTSPLSAARVLMDQEVVGVTDAEGLAVVRGVGPHFQMFEVSADGYAPSFLSMWLAPDPGGTIDRTATMSRGAALGGVVLGPDGGPVPDATVRISGDSWSGDATTNATGVWHVDAVVRGTYRIVGSSTAHAPAPDLIVELDGTHARTDVAVNVLRGATLAGKVVDASGAAVARPLIVAIKTEEEHPAERSVRGDDIGCFEILGVEPAVYRVFAHEGQRASAESRVVLADGETSRVEFVVEPGAIAGVVVDTQGTPIGGAEVRAWNDLVRGDLTDDRGRFDLGAFPPGEYDIRAWWPDQQERARGATAKIFAGNTNAQLVLPSTTTIRGRVLLDDVPMQHFGVLLATCPQFPWIGRPVGVHAADGRFVLRGVTPGSWGIVIAGPGTAMHTISKITVEEGGAIDLGDLQMTRGQRITGHVRDSAGMPVARARVTIGRRGGEAELDGDPLQQWFSCDFETTTDADGAFAFDGVTSVRPPHARPTPISARDSGRGSSVAVAVPDGDASVDLVLVETGTIEGTVDAYTGRFAMISAHRHGEPADLRSGKLSAAGKFMIERVPPGEYTITMTSMPELPTAAPVKVSVVANELANVRLVVDRVGHPNPTNSGD